MRFLILILVTAGCFSTTDKSEHEENILRQMRTASKQDDCGSVKAIYQRSDVQNFRYEERRKAEEINGMASFQCGVKRSRRVHEELYKRRSESERKARISREKRERKYRDAREKNRVNNEALKADLDEKVKTAATQASASIFIAHETSAGFQRVRSKIDKLSETFTCHDANMNTNDLEQAKRILKHAKDEDKVALERLEKVNACLESALPGKNER